MAKKWTKILMGTALLSGIAAAAYWYKKKYMDTPKYDEDLDDFDLDDYDFDEDEFKDSEDTPEDLKNEKAAFSEEAVTTEENTKLPLEEDDDALNDLADEALESMLDL